MPIAINQEARFLLSNDNSPPILIKTTTGDRLVFGVRGIQSSSLVTIAILWSGHEQSYKCNV